MKWRYHRPPARYNGLTSLTSLPEITARTPMTAAARVQPEAFFTPGEWAQLSRRSRWKGLALVAHGWAALIC